MRNPIILLPVVLVLALLWPLAAVRAQVTVDLRALDALPHTGPAPAPRTTAPGAHPAPPRATVEAAPSAPAQPMPGPAAAPGAVPPPPAVASTPAAPPAQPPALPTQAPAVADLAPIPPPQNVAPPPPPPVSATADTHAQASHAGLRVTFDPTGTELSPSSVEAIRSFATATSRPDATFNVLAYAAGSPNDPSAARRLSLSRALAVRAALMADGIASSRIFVRALGSPTDNSPPDRVDIDRLGANAPAARAQ